MAFFLKKFSFTSKRTGQNNQLKVVLEKEGKPFRNDLQKCLKFRKVWLFYSLKTVANRSKPLFPT